MKKKFLFVSALVVMAMCASLISCEKKDSVSESKDEEKEEINGCKCTVTWDDGEKETIKYDLEEMEDYFDVSTCSKLQKILLEDAEGVEKLTCKEY